LSSNKTLIQNSPFDPQDTLSATVILGDKLRRKKERNNAKRKEKQRKPNADDSSYRLTLLLVNLFTPIIISPFAELEIEAIKLLESPLMRITVLFFMGGLES